MLHALQADVAFFPARLHVPTCAALWHSQHLRVLHQRGASSSHQQWHQRGAVINTPAMATTVAASPTRMTILAAVQLWAFTGSDLLLLPLPAGCRTCLCLYLQC